MPYEPSLNSLMKPQGTYSDGPSLPSLLNLWEGKISNQLDPELHISGVLKTTNGNIEFHGDDYGEDAYLRGLCHIIIGALPNEGLRETMTDLADLYDYYSYEPIVHDRVPALPNVSSVGYSPATLRPRSVFTE